MKILDIESHRIDASFAALQISMHLALVCDPVTSHHSLYLDEPQYNSGVIYSIVT